MARTKLDDALKEAKQGLSRVFAKGGERFRISSQEAYKLFGITEFGDLGFGRDDDSTFEIPSTRDGLTTSNRLASTGAPTIDTGSFSQLIDEAGDEGYMKAARRQFPFMWWVPFKGEDGVVDDPNSFGWAALIDRVLIRNWRQQDTANPSDRTLVGQGIRWGGEYQYDGALFHDYYPLVMEEEHDSTATEVMVACAARDLATRGTEFFAITAAATAAKPKVYARNTMGKWQSAVTLASVDNAEDVDAAFVVAGYLVMPSDDAVGHVVFNLADILDGESTDVLVTSGYTASKGPRCGVGRSATEMVFGGTGGVIYKTSSLFGAVSVVDNAAATTQNLLAASEFGDSIVIVGSSNAVAVSKDYGDTWATVTGPKAATELSAVELWDEETIFVGTAPTSGLAELYVSEDFGASWVSIDTPLRANKVTDIKFLRTGQFPSGAGYIVGNDTTTDALKGRLARTNDGGSSWFVAGNHVDSVDESETLVSVAVGTCNNVISVGKGTDSTADGVILISERD